MIGTCGGSPRKLVDRKRFNDGIDELVKRLHPHTVVVYGSAKYPCFEKLREHGITVIEISSRMMKAFEGRAVDE